MVVGYLVEEAEQGHLVRAESRRGVPGADVLDGDGGGGQRRQHQPLPEVPAAGESPGLFAPHSCRRRTGLRRRRGGVRVLARADEACGVGRSGSES